MRLMIRALVVRFCRARAEAAARRALRARFASTVVLADVASSLAPRGSPLPLEVSRLRMDAERDECSAREWRDLANQLEAL